MAFKTVLNPFTGELQLINSSSSGTGNVTGIPPTTPGAIARWVDTGGTTIENSPNTFVQDGGGIESSGFLTSRSVTTLVHVPPEYTWIASEIEIELTGAIEIELDGEVVIV